MMTRLNEKGMSIVEVLVAVAMLSVLVVTFTNLLKTQSNKNQEGRLDDMINETSRIISQALNEKDSCNDLVGSSPNGSLNLATISSSLPTTTEEQVDLLSATSSAISTGSGLHKVPINVVLSFRKNLADGKTKTVSQRLVTALAQYNGSSFVSCIDSEDELRRDSLRIVCEMLGATYSDSGTGTESCDFSSIDPDSEFGEAFKRTLCEELYQGSYNAATDQCSALEVTGNFLVQNLELSRVRLGSGNWRSEFTQACPGTNNFIRSIDRDGSVGCVEVSMCTVGVDCGGTPVSCSPDCSCATSITSDQTCSDGCGGSCTGLLPPPVNCTPSCVGEDSYNANQTFADSCGNANACSGTRCDYRDNYSIVGGNCRFRNYASTTSTPGVCSNYSDSVATTPACRTIESGSCAGSRPASYQNVADGTSCGGGNVCQNGSCVAASAGCTISSAVTWSVDSKNCTSLEGFNMATGTFNPIQMTDGESREFRDTLGIMGDPKGSVTLTCDNGSLIQSNKVCGGIGFDFEQPNIGPR